MNEFGPFTDNELPLQMDIFPKIDAWHPDIGYMQLEPDNHTDLVLDEVGNLANGKGYRSVFRASRILTKSCGTGRSSSSSAPTTAWEWSRRHRQSSPLSASKQSFICCQIIKKFYDEAFYFSNPSSG